MTTTLTAPVRTVIARASGKGILLQAPYDLKETLKTLPGIRWDPSLKVWVLNETPGHARAVRDTLRSCGLKVMANAAFSDLLEVFEAPMPANTALRPIPVTKQIPSPWPHQVEAFWFAMEHPGCLLHMWMGTGKSRVAVDVLQNSVPKLTVIACPTTVMDVWPAEFRKYAVANFRVIVPDRAKTIAERVERINVAIDATLLAGETPVVVINYESLQREMLEWINAEERLECVIYDEIHKVKDPHGVRSRAIGKLATKVPRRLGLTGTLMPHSPLDAFAQFRALDQAVFGPSFSRYRARYAVLRQAPWGAHVIGYQRHEELRSLIGEITYTCDKSVLKLPEPVHVERKFSLGPVSRKIYDQLEKEFYAWLDEGKEVTADNALVKLLRLRQTTSGYVKTNDDVEQRIGSEKATVLQDVLEELGDQEPVVIFCQFVHDLDRVHEAVRSLATCLTCGREYPAHAAGDCEWKPSYTSLELSGRRKDLAEWQQGAAPVLAVQIQSGGVGLDMTRARYCVYYSLGFNLGEYEQSLARVHRPPQTKNVVYVHLLAINTVDVKVQKALQDRKNVVEAVMNDRRGMAVVAV